MEKLDIEIAYSPTGSCSSWHLEIAERYGINLFVTSDVAYFMRINDDVYRIDRPFNHLKLQQWLEQLEADNDCGELTDVETLECIDDLVNNRIDGYRFKKMTNLKEFEKIMVERKNKQDEKKSS